MATFTATAAQANAIPVYQVGGLVARNVVYSLSLIGASLSAAGDVIQMVKIPAHAIIQTVRVGINGHTGVATVNVGLGSDISLYGASVVLSGSTVASNIMPVRALGYSLSAEDTIDIQCAAVSAASAVGALYLSVTYTNQDA